MGEIVAFVQDFSAASAALFQRQSQHVEQLEVAGIPCAEVCVGVHVRHVERRAEDTVLNHLLP